MTYALTTVQNKNFVLSDDENLQNFFGRWSTSYFIMGKTRTLLSR